FMFTSREYFSLVALYDFRKRFYRPSLGRFLQSDPTGFGAGDANLFRYCGGDPVNSSDPSGENATIKGFGNGAYNFNMNIYFANSNMAMAKNFVDYANNRLTDTFGS